MYIINEGLNLLIVDDEESLRSILNDILSKEFENIFEASDGDIAIEILKNNKVDIILTDINMPNVSGIELFDFVLEKKIDVELLFITGFADKKMSQLMMRKGAFDVIEKPFEEDLVLGRVKNAKFKLVRRRLEMILLESIAKMLNFKSPSGTALVSDSKRIEYFRALIGLMEVKNRKIS
ncbi:MAG: response regulator [Halobacteriovoraceae bacterium]|nr:response regulator [Halobacteriovoraceae bacterium]